MRFAQELEKTPHLISEIKKNELVVEDKPQEVEKVLKKVKKNIFNLALGNRNSRSSVKSDSSLREPPVRTEPSHPSPLPLPQHPTFELPSTSSGSNGNEPKANH